MQDTKCIGNVNIVYNTEDYNKETYQKSYNKIYLTMGAIIILGIAMTVALSMYLEYIVHETWVSILVMVVGTIASVAISLVYVSHTDYLSTRVWDILNWFTTCPDIEAGYFNGRIMLLAKSNSYNLKNMLNKSGVEYTIDESAVKDKSQSISLEINFTDKLKTVVKVSNTEE